MLCATGQRLQEDFWVKMLRRRYKSSSGSFGSVQRGRVAGVRVASFVATCVCGRRSLQVYWIATVLFVTGDIESQVYR